MAEVAPLWVRGLKHAGRRSLQNAFGRTLMGAWIETLPAVPHLDHRQVAPLWVRGLKLNPTGIPLLVPSRTLMGAWIET